MIFRFSYGRASAETIRTEKNNIFDDEGFAIPVEEIISMTKKPIDLQTKKESFTGRIFFFKKGYRLQFDVDVLVHENDLEALYNWVSTSEKFFLINLLDTHIDAFAGLANTRLGLFEINNNLDGEGNFYFDCNLKIQSRKRISKAYIVSLMAERILINAS